MSEASVWETHARALRLSVPFVQLERALRSRSDAGASVAVSRLPVAAAAWVTELLAERLGRPVLVLVPHDSQAYSWLEAARLFGRGRVTYFPAPSLSPYQEAEISLLVRAEESVALAQLAAGSVRTVVATPRALFRRLPPLRQLRPAAVEIEAGEEILLDELIAHLLRFGYRRTDLVMEVGELALRGGVLDVFPPGEVGPVRLDLFGDTVDVLLRFDVDSQRSGDTLERVRLLPLSLFGRGEQDALSLADRLAEQVGVEHGADAAHKLGALRSQGGFDGWEHYLPALAPETVGLAQLIGNPLVVAFDPQGLATEANHHAEILSRDYTARLEEERLVLPPEALELPADEVARALDGAAVEIADLFDRQRGTTIDFAGSQTEEMRDQLQRFAREVETLHAGSQRVVLVTAASQRVALGELLEGAEVTLGSAGVELVSGDLQRGFRLPAAKLALFGERQLFRHRQVVRPARPKRRYGPFISSLRDLKVGDYVVHADHGIGQFTGLRTMGEEGRRSDLPPELAAAVTSGTVATEVMELAYANGKRLMMPLSRLDQVQKYSGIESIVPRLDKLGGTSWAKTKKRIHRGVRDMAKELLKLYAERQMAKAPPMTEDSDLTRQFGAAFEHVETPDQLDAIKAIKKDLQSSRPMDRLLCGDVGFGKTEVAMRAAFQVVASNYQVAVLAPTTILADQHLQTFRRRFADFPVRVEMVSRFRSKARVKEISDRLAQGEVDILIGTHRLLSKDLDFARLGMLIIDEEQRFGVAQKERLKKLRKDVHVLAMSATPVPRTLQLSLAGVRDLSLIETPPRNRMAVETAILPFDPVLIREAVELEIERGGQVYYVYNRVETIEQMAEFLKQTVPGLKVTVGHGQLNEGELARRMHAFVDGEYHLLLATTIIENGIDIPNVNTMIVHRADRFGLSQLYQLRGRVGRSDQLAYCYLLVPGDTILTEVARKRLDAIREFTELGAGFRVAGRDLEIRGAGNLLGAEQSGHIAAVGIETYLKMLEDTVRELKGDGPPEAVSVALDLPLAMSIPESYIGDANLRMEIYRRIATGEDGEDELLTELRDRFGAPPEEVRTLLVAAAVKQLAEDLRLQAISARRGRLTLSLRQDSRVDIGRLIELVSEREGASFSPSGVLTFERVAAVDLLPTARWVLDQLAT